MSTLKLSDDLIINIRVPCADCNTTHDNRKLLLQSEAWKSRVYTDWVWIPEDAMVLKAAKTAVNVGKLLEEALSEVLRGPGMQTVLHLRLSSASSVRSWNNTIKRVQKAKRKLAEQAEEVDTGKFFYLDRLWEGAGKIDASGERICLIHPSGIAMVGLHERGANGESDTINVSMQSCDPKWQEFFISLPETGEGRVEICA